MEVISVRFDPLLEIVFTFYTYTLGDPPSNFFLGIYKYANNCLNIDLDDLILYVQLHIISGYVLKSHYILACLELWENLAYFPEVLS